VPITPALAAKLKATAHGRDGEDLLLLHRDGRPWAKSASEDYRDDVRSITDALGFGAEVTVYSLRHSSVTRQLLKNVPVRVVAATHNTSVAQIEACYSAFIAEHSDELSRAALLATQEEPAPSAVVLPMAR
jgi:hypothetical protein